MLIASLWIYFSDLLLDVLFSEDVNLQFQTYKGLFFVLVTGFALHVTIRRLYQEIERREVFYHETLNEASIGMVEFDDQKILFSNRYFQQLFGFDEKSMHMNLIDLVHPTSIADVKRAIAFVHQQGKPISIEIKSNHSHTGNWLSLHLTRVQREDETHYFAITTDISTAKQFSLYTDILLRILLVIDAKENAEDMYKSIILLLLNQTGAIQGMLYVYEKNQVVLQFNQDGLVTESNQPFTDVYLKESTTVETLDMEDSIWVCIPLFDGRFKIGNILLQKSKTDTFDDDELTFFKIISTDLGIKISQKKLQFQRNRDEENQRLLLESASVATWEMDLKTGITKRSANHSKINDADDDPTKEWDFQRFMNSLHPEDVLKLTDIYNHIIEKKLENFDFEYRHTSKTDGYRWAQSTGKVHYDSDGNPSFLSGITIDIHERKRNEELLRESEETYKDLFENNPAALLIVKMDTFHFLGANKSAQFLYGYSEDQLLELTLTDLKPSNDKSLFKIPNEILDSHGFFRLGLWKHRKANNDLMYVDLAVSSIYYRGKRAYLLQVNEVTNVILSQQALSKSEAKYRTLFQENPQPLVIVDEHHEVILDVNETACHFFEKTKKELLKKRLSDVFGDRVALEIEVLMDRVPQEKVVRTETRMNLSTEEDRIIQITAVKSDVDQTPAIILFLMDITSTKESEQRAMRAFIEGEDKERERMAKELHDSLGQVLTAASMNLKSAQKELKDADFKRKEQFIKGVQFVHQAIDETRTIAQNLMPKTISDFGLISSLDLLIGSYKETLPFSIDLHHNLKDIRLSRVVELNVYRIIQEALTNVIKYAEAEHVLISIDYSRRSLRVEIKDDGKGMELTQIDQANGIGLKNMRSRVSIMSGELFIDSIPGSGTTIIVIIPLYHE